MIPKSDRNVVAKVNKKKKKSEKHDESSAVSPNAKLNRLTKGQKKEIEGQADDEAGAIAEEVGVLLAHLKEEHGFSDYKPGHVSATETSGKKKNKSKKGKLPKTLVVSESEWQGSISTEVGCISDLSMEIETTASPKKVNKKRKKQELEEKSTANEIAESLSGNPKKKKKNIDAIQVAESKPHVNKKNVVKLESMENRNFAVKTEEMRPILKTKKKQKLKTETESDVGNVKGGSTSKNVNTNETAEEKPKTEYYLKNTFPVYVGNLPTNVKKKRLLKLFMPCGEVLAVRLRTNTGKNFMSREQLKKVPFVVAFVYFATEEAAEASLKLTGEKVGDNIIYVDRDLDKKDEKSKMNAKTTVFVGNLKYQTTNAMLQDTFKCCGEIKYVRTIQCKFGCKGTAYVCFKEPESVVLAMKLNKTLLLDREIRVERFHTKKLGGGKSNSKEDEPHLQGAALRVAKKSGIESGRKSFVPDMKCNEPKNDKKKKEFLGTKSNAKKQKKFDPKKKVKVSAMKKLATKIAPKSTA